MRYLLATALLVATVLAALPAHAEEGPVDLTLAYAVPPMALVGAAGGGGVAPAPSEFFLGVSAPTPGQAGPLMLASLGAHYGFPFFVMPFVEAHLGTILDASRVWLGSGVGAKMMEMKAQVERDEILAESRGNVVRSDALAQADARRIGAQALADVERSDAQAQGDYDRMVAQHLSPQTLELREIEGLSALATSPNAKLLFMGDGKAPSLLDLRSGRSDSPY